MDASEIGVGLKVRYPRTGTEGKVESLETIGGEVFAQIDATHLFYRADQIFAVEKLKKHAEAEEEDVIERIKKERAGAAEEIQKGFERWDGECGG
jgi:hypothetical protein